MSDLIERLRDLAKNISTELGSSVCVADEAADEIERLGAENGALRAARNADRRLIDGLQTGLGKL